MLSHWTQCPSLASSVLLSYYTTCSALGYSCKFCRLCFKGFFKHSSGSGFWRARFSETWRVLQMSFYSLKPLILIQVFIFSEQNALTFSKTQLCTIDKTDAKGLRSSPTCRLKPIRIMGRKDLRNPNSCIKPLFLMSMSILCIARCTQSSKGGTRSCRTGGEDACEPSYGYWELNTGSSARATGVPNV